MVVVNPEPSSSRDGAVPLYGWRGVARGAHTTTHVGQNKAIYNNNNNNYNKNGG